MPRISCVIATRDRDNYIEATIRSIIDQTESDWELLIIDDHSQPGDTTEAVVGSFDDNRIKYFKLPDQNGMGIAAARNFGNYLAGADYVAVMDSDDLCYPKRFQRTLEAAASSKADLIYSDYDFWTEGSHKTETYKSRDFNLSDFKRYDFIPHASSTYRRQAVLDFPYNSFFRRAEDYDLFARLHSFGYKFHYIPESTIKVRMHQASITRNKNDQFDYPKIVKQNRLWQEA